MYIGLVDYDRARRLIVGPVYYIYDRVFILTAPTYYCAFPQYSTIQTITPQIEKNLTAKIVPQCLQTHFYAISEDNSSNYHTAILWIIFWKS